MAARDGYDSLREAIAGQEQTVNAQEGIVDLTDREIEVLGLILEGKSSKEAAEILCCSKRTVDCHLTRIYGKLGVSNRVQALRRVATLGLIHLDSDEGRFPMR